MSNREPFIIFKTELSFPLSTPTQIRSLSGIPRLQWAAWRPAAAPQANIVSPLSSPLLSLWPSQSPDATHSISLQALKYISLAL